MSIKKRKYQVYFDPSFETVYNVATALKKNANKIRIDFSIDNVVPENFLALEKFEQLELDFEGLHPSKIKTLLALCCQLTNVKSINLSENTLMQLPENIYKIKNLESLSLYNVDINSLPEDFKKLKLKSLNLHRTSIKNLDCILEIDSLEHLNLRDTKVSIDFLLKITKLKNLKSLNLQRNFLKELPDVFGTLPNLEEIILESNDIKNLPSSFASLKNLNKLNLRKNKHLNWAQVFDIMRELPRLTHLDFSHYGLNTIDPKIQLMTQLTHLDISNNHFKEIPECVLKLENIEEINFNFNPDIDYAKDLSSLTNLPKLKKITIEKYDKEKLPQVIKLFQGIEELSLINCQIKELPQEITTFNRLKRLSIYNCFQLDSENVFKKISQCKNLIYLKFNSANDTKIPASIGKLKKLNIIDFNGYDSLDIADAFIKIKQLPKLEKLICSQEKCIVPKEITHLKHLKSVCINFYQRYGSKAVNHNRKFPLEMSMFSDIVFESNIPDVFEKLNSYISTFGRSKIDEDKKKMLFAYLTNNTYELSQTIKNPLVQESFEPSKSIFFIKGKINSFQRKTLETRLRSHQIKIASKLHSKVKYVVLGELKNKEILENFILNNDYIIVLEEHLRDFFNTNEEHYLKDENAIEMNKNIINLLMSFDNENILLADTLIDAGGAVQEIITYATVIHLFHPNAEVRKNARKIFKKHASNDLQKHIKLNWRVSLRTTCEHNEYLKVLYTHPELDSALFLLLKTKLVWLTPFLAGKLIWSNLSFETIPDKIGNYSEIREVKLNNNPQLDWKHTFKVLSNLPDLQILEINNSAISNLPDALFELNSLTELRLINNNISEIPDKIKNLKNLEKLYLSNNPINSLPASITNLKLLHTLHANNCAFDNFKYFVGIKNLKHLYLNSNKFKQIDKSFSKLNALIQVDISNNQIETIDKEACQLQSLKDLYLLNNKIKTLPDFLLWSSLEKLYLEGNQLKSLPQSLSNCKKLIQLCLSYNNFTEVPKLILTLKALETVSLEANKIDSFPKFLPKCENLIACSLKENLIKEIPENLEDFKKLTALELTKNQIKELPNKLPLPFHKLNNNSRSVIYLGLRANPISPKNRKIYKEKFYGISFYNEVRVYISTPKYFY